jgi:hypothetical protein
MKKNLKVILIMSISIIFITGCVYGVFALIEANQASSTMGGLVLKDKKYMTYDCYSNYKYVFMKLDINTSDCKRIVSYDIKDASGNILDSGDITSPDKMLAINKNFQGKKGTWYIEFRNVADDEKIGVTYTIEGRNTYESRFLIKSFKGYL